MPQILARLASFQLRANPAAQDSQMGRLFCTRGRKAGLTGEGQRPDLAPPFLFFALQARLGLGRHRLSNFLCDQPDLAQPLLASLALWLFLGVIPLTQPSFSFLVFNPPREPERQRCPTRLQTGWAHTLRIPLWVFRRRFPARGSH